MFKVLIADIEPLQRRCVKLLLEERYRRQIVIVEADSGELACEIYHNSHVDLVIMDYRLTGMNGLNTAIEMKKHNPLQKLLILTLVGDEQVQESFSRLGVDDYLVKPLRPRVLIEEVSKVLSQNRQYPTRKINLKISEIVQFIEVNLNEDLTLTYVAEKMNLSSYYLSKIFKKELGINFVRYVTERKIEKAKELLRNVDIPVVHVARAIGYSEPSYFTKVFKRVETITPSQYRNQYIR